MNTADSLPVLAFKDEILASVDANQVTIITAETGAGKSTQVPQYLAEHGYNKVIVTQPRILAARNLCIRVREEWAARNSENSAPIIGYRTAHERDDSAHTKILYCTDGLQLVRELTGSGIKEKQVLVLDEVHEWNENMEVLIAWAKKRCTEDPEFKIVIMSATLEADTLAEYFATKAVISVPGRSYPVERIEGTDVIAELISIIESPEVNNVLVFLPGKAEIQDVADTVMEQAVKAKIPIIPLHSQLEPEQQQLVFGSYPNGKIILATNIAQTSITIDDIDVVVDSGLERRSEVRSGVEGLFIAQVSQADCLQRAGRAGRTKPGRYILAQYDVLPCMPFDERDAYGVPEILRKHIDRLALRLANVGIDIEELDFYHDPSRRAIKQAKHTLVQLGALTGRGEVTDIGRVMEQYPVESHYARMLVESKNYSNTVQSKLAAMIALHEVGGIVRSGTRYNGWRKYTNQTVSDVLAQYEVFLSIATIDEAMFEELGIIGKNIDKALEVMQRLNRDLADIELDHSILSAIEDDEQEPLLLCIVAGMMGQIWTVDEHYTATHIATKDKREMSSTSVVKNPYIVVGMPFDLQVPVQGSDGELQTLHLLQEVTKVKVDWLTAFAPNLFIKLRGKLGYDARLGALITRQYVRVGKKVIEGFPELVTENSHRNQQLFQEAFSKWAYERVERERSILANSHHVRVPLISLHQIKRRVEKYAAGVVSLDTLPSSSKAQLIKLASFETYVDENFMNELAHSFKRNSYRRNHNGRRKNFGNRSHNNFKRR